MNANFLAVVSLSALTSALVADTAGADVVQYEFSGSFEDVSDPRNVFMGAKTWKIQFGINESAPDLIPGDSSAFPTGGVQVFLDNTLFISEGTGTLSMIMTQQLHQLGVTIRGFDFPNQSFTSFVWSATARQFGVPLDFLPGEELITTPQEFELGVDYNIGDVTNLIDIETSGGDFVTAYAITEKIVITPTPGSFAVLAMGGLVGSRRRR